MQYATSTSLNKSLKNKGFLFVVLGVAWKNLIDKQTQFLTTIANGVIASVFFCN